MSNILGNMPPVFGSGYRGVVPAPTAADVSAQNILRADGVWAAGPSGTLPSQTGNAGELLTTDGTNASWASSLNTFQFGDVTLGTSGPSVKSTLSARAPRQGLVFDGTLGASMSTASLGTGDFTFSAVFKAPAITNSNYSWLFGGNTSMGIAVWTQGVRLTKVNVAEVTTFTATISPSLWYHLAVVKASGFITAYLNGVQIGTPFNDSAGTYTGSAVIGGYSGTSSLVTALSVISPLIYNRALSASEVVALYEAGAPAGSDYNNASNTALNTVAWSNEVAALSGFSATTTSFSCTATNNGGVASIRPAMTMRPQAKYRITYTYNDSVPLYVVDGAGFSLLLSTGTAVTREFTYTGTGGFRTALYPAGSGSVSVTSISFIAVGLLLAPDAAQAGGGLTWYDTSGNAANITLPASGVSWNVPSSRVLGGNWTTSGNHVVSGGSIGVGGAVGSYFDILQGGNDAYAYNRRAGQLIFGTNNTTVMQFASNGNCLLKSDGIDSANGKLQLATHTTSAGGIGFGTDTSLYRGASGIGTLELSASSGTVSIFKVALAGTAKAQFGIAAGATYIDYDGSLIVRNGIGGTTALTLASDQSATFQNTVTLYTVGASSTGQNSLIFTGADGNGNVRTPAKIIGKQAGNGGYGNLVLQTAFNNSLVDALTLDSSQRCILAGALRLNNAYVAGAPTATGYVTLQDSAGNTYKVLVGT